MRCKCSAVQAASSGGWMEKVTIVSAWWEVRLEETDVQNLHLEFQNEASHRKRIPRRSEQQWNTGERGGHWLFQCRVSYLFIFHLFVFLSYFPRPVCAPLLATWQKPAIKLQPVICVLSSLLTFSTFCTLSKCILETLSLLKEKISKWWHMKPCAIQIDAI